MSALNTVVATTALESLHQLLLKTNVELVFNPAWGNGTGYFDGAANGPVAPSLARGQHAKFTDDQGRVALIVGTQHGNIVLFQRHPDEGMVVINSPRMCGIENGSKSPDDIQNILDIWG